MQIEKIKKYIHIDAEIMGGQPVFKGTRVPIESLFLHLAEGISVDDFIRDFPTVSKEQASTIIKIAGKIFSSKIRLNTF